MANDKRPYAVLYSDNWNKPWFNELTDAEMRFWTYVHLCPHRKHYGFIKLGSHQLAHEAKVSHEVAQDMLDLMEEHGEIKVVDGGFGIVFTYTQMEIHRNTKAALRHNHEKGHLSDEAFDLILDVWNLTPEEVATATGTNTGKGKVGYDFVGPDLANRDEDNDPPRPRSKRSRRRSTEPVE